MKRILIVSVLLLATLLSQIYAVLLLNRSAETMISGLSRISRLAETRPSDAERAMKQLLLFWDQTEPKISLFINEHILEELDSRLLECSALLREKEPESFRLAAGLTSEAIRNLIRQQLPTIRNILRASVFFPLPGG